MNDLEFLRAILERGPASTMEIIAASIRERGCGITPHSRAAELRAELKPQGVDVVCRREGTDARGRAVYVYELTATTLSETEAGLEGHGNASASVSLRARRPYERSDLPAMAVATRYRDGTPISSLRPEPGEAARADGPGSERSDGIANQTALSPTSPKVTPSPARTPSETQPASGFVAQTLFPLDSRPTWES